MSQLPVPGVRNVMGGLIGPYEKRKTKWQMALGGSLNGRWRVVSLLGAAALSIAAGMALITTAISSPAHGASFHHDIFAADQTAPIVLAGLSAPVEVTSPLATQNANARPSLPQDEASNLLPGVGLNDWINVIAVLAVIWIALRTERLRRQSDDTGRFRRLHERMDDHSRRLAAHETRLQGLPTHKDLARIDARLVAVEHTMQQIAHSVTRMEDFLINGAAASTTVMEAPNDT